MGSRIRGFTLVELLVVMVIILLVSVLAIPAAIHAYGERGVQEGAQLVMSALSAARDEAARTNSPRGIRFLPDPTTPEASNRIVPMETAPDYSEGTLSATDPATLPAGFTVPYPWLMVEQADVARPPSWAYNVRVGDRLRIGTSGSWYTVVGPTDPASPTSEGFVAPAVVLDRRDGRGPIDYLWLADGLDDDGNGFIDDGWDGIDNNANGAIDEPLEWEAERWLSPVAAGSAYTIRRRPVPAGPSRAIELPAGAIIDLAGLPSEIMIEPHGGVRYSGPYGTPSSSATYQDSSGMLQIRHDVRIHVVERGSREHEAWVVLDTRTGRVTAE